MKDWQYSHLFIKRKDVQAMFAYCTVQYYYMPGAVPNLTEGTKTFGQLWHQAVRTVFVTEEQLCLDLGKTFQAYDFQLLLTGIVSEADDLSNYLSRNMARLLWKDACAQVRIDEYNHQPKPLWERFMDWLH